MILVLLSSGKSTAQDSYKSLVLILTQRKIETEMNPRLHPFLHYSIYINYKKNIIMNRYEYFKKYLRVMYKFSKEVETIDL